MKRGKNTLFCARDFTWSRKSEEETDEGVFELPSEASKGQVIKVDFCHPYNLLIIRSPCVRVQAKQVIRLSVLSTHFWLQEGGTLAVGKQYLLVSDSILTVRKQLTENPKVRNKLEKVTALLLGNWGNSFDTA